MFFYSRGSPPNHLGAHGPIIHFHHAQSSGSRDRVVQPPLVVLFIAVIGRCEFGSCRSRSTLVIATPAPAPSGCVVRVSPNLARIGGGGHVRRPIRILFFVRIFPSGTLIEWHDFESASVLNLDLFTGLVEAVEKESSQAQNRPRWHSHEEEIARGHDHLPLGVLAEVAARQGFLSPLHQMDESRERHLQAGRLQGRLEALGVAQKQARHELRNHGPCIKVQ